MNRNPFDKDAKFKPTPGKDNGIKSALLRRLQNGGNKGIPEGKK